MRNPTTLGAAVLAGIMVLAGTACDKLKARDHINQGAASFKSAKYADAVEHFKTAIALDPELPTARQYLATSYMVQWIPGAESPENLQFAGMALAEFNKILEKDPNDRSALTSLAYMSYNQAQSLPQDQKLAKFDEAVKLYQRMISADPTNKENKEAYYTLGVISYNRWNPALMLARSNLRMRAEDPGPIKDKKVKEQLKGDYNAVIQDGVQNLQKALEIDIEYDDAMAYLNLMIRTKADLLDTPDEYTKEIKSADDWLQKALDTKKIKAARAEKKTGGIVQEAPPTN
jgi:tetratricopeptide (TPR) repeat protein